jgi:L-ascorbate metabolism protein UlaG (beta-lactamase superfamily)
MAILIYDEDNRDRCGFFALGPDFHGTVVCGDSSGDRVHLKSMMKIRELWGTRPFWIDKLGQLSKLVWESHANPMEGEPQVAVEVEPDELGVTFIGHSSFLLQIASKNVMVDPVFATRLVVLRRQRRPGLKMRRLPGVDVVLLTHAHMDHLNRPSLRRIARQTKRRTGKAPVVVVPQGVEDLVESLGFSEVLTMRLWETIEVDGLKVTLTPCQHWGARMFHDTHRGFGGYVIEGGALSVYHSGDTAYFAGFKEIGERLAPQVALLPIGGSKTGCMWWGRVRRWR